MANRRDIKRRIHSVVNTQKITKAMKLVSAAKFARASHAVISARPYSNALRNMTSNLILSHEIESPLVKQKTEKSILVVILTSDRGLCGSINNNLLKQVRRWVDEKSKNGIKSDFICWGRKAVSWSKKQKETLVEGKEKFLEKPTYILAKQLTDMLAKIFLNGQYDAIYVVVNEFKSVLVQEPKINKFLPVFFENEKETVNTVPFIVEPSLSEMIDELISRNLASSMFQFLLDNVASEHGARMTAMESATNNANEVRKKLTLKYNRARQAAITSELIEIISGAEAL